MDTQGLSTGYSPLGGLDLYNALEREYERVSREIEVLTQSLSDFLVSPQSRKRQHNPGASAYVNHGETCSGKEAASPYIPAERPQPHPTEDVPCAESAI